MGRLGLWSVAEGKPTRLPTHDALLETHLEEWIKNDPSLVLDGLRWVGQQVVLPDRRRIDLLGISREGQWVVAELKRGMVGLATLSQALHYLMVVGSLDSEALLSRTNLVAGDRDEVEDTLRIQEKTERDLMVLLVGTGRLPDLDEGIDFLSRRGFDVTVRVVTFNTFTDGRGGVLLAREIEEREVEAAVSEARSSRHAKVEWVLDRAKQMGQTAVFNRALKLATDLDLGVKPWPKSITISPSTARNRTLVYVGLPKEKVHIGYSTENLEDFYGVPPEGTEDALGPNWIDLEAEDALEFLERFEAFMIRALEARTAERVNDSNAPA